MTSPFKILIALFILLMPMVLCLEYLDSLHTQAVSGMTATRDGLKTVYEAKLLSWTLPKPATRISFWITPSNRYYEADFKIEKEHFEEWIEEVQGGEVTAGDYSEKLTPEHEARYSLIPIPIPNGIDFHLRSIEKGSTKITEGYWLPQITTSKFRAFSAAYDTKTSHAHVYFYR